MKTIYDKATERTVAIPDGYHTLVGDLVIPENAKGIVLFAHGSGSGRHSPRNRFVAEEMNQVGLATLLVDLLSEEEANDREKVFDIELLAGRLLDASEWLLDHPETSTLRLGLFGASTGAAAALRMASQFTSGVHAIVSRGGRPDLAGECLGRVRAPTLLIVGGHDFGVIELNQSAYDLLGCEKEIVLVPGATHLFPEPGALERVADLAKDWFLRHLDSNRTEVN